MSELSKYKYNIILFPFYDLFRILFNNIQKYIVFDAENLYVHWIKNLFYQRFVLRWICSLFWMIFYCYINSVSSIANPRLYYCFHDSSWLENERELLLKPYIYQKKTCKQEKACAFNRCLYLSKKPLIVLVRSILLRITSFVSYLNFIL